MKKIILAAGLLSLSALMPACAGNMTKPLLINPKSIDASAYAVKTYQLQMEQTLAEMVRFKTVAEAGKVNRELPEFISFKQYLEKKATELGFDFNDLGEVVVIGYGKAKNKLGITTHGDVQPADPSRWTKSPFELDGTTEPDKWIARGTEDDKGAIATALYAMKSIKDLELPLSKRIELIISMTEESDWEPFREFVASYDVPQTNIVIDSSYPAVVAEKAWCTIHSYIPQSMQEFDGPQIISYGGGAFISQVPELAQAELVNVNKALLSKIKQKAESQQGMQYRFEQKGNSLLIKATGKAAHSASPQAGINALSHLADSLSVYDWPKTQAAQTVNYVNSLIGLSITGENYGEIAYQHDFMGPMTVNLSFIKPKDNAVEIAINMRRPVGKEQSVLKEQIENALAKWQQTAGVNTQSKIFLQDAYYPENAEHTQPVLNVFSHFTGMENPQPKSIGGSTHSKLLPNSIGFGPSMPGKHYTGHSEHEYLTKEQFVLNLKMYTAVMVEVAGAAD